MKVSFLESDRSFLGGASGTLRGIALAAAVVMVLLGLGSAARQARDPFARADYICQTPPGVADSPERHQCLAREMSKSPFATGLPWFGGAVAALVVVIVATGFRVKSDGALFYTPS